MPKHQPNAITISLSSAYREKLERLATEGESLGLTLKRLVTGLLDENSRNTQGQVLVTKEDFCSSFNALSTQINNLQSRIEQMEEKTQLEVKMAEPVISARIELANGRVYLANKRLAYVVSNGSFMGYMGGDNKARLLKWSKTILTPDWSKRYNISKAIVTMNGKYELTVQCYGVQEGIDCFDWLATQDLDKDPFNR